MLQLVLCVGISGSLWDAFKHPIVPGNMPAETAATAPETTATTAIGVAGVGTTHHQPARISEIHRIISDISIPIETLWVSQIIAAIKRIRLREPLPLTLIPPHHRLIPTI